MIKVARGRDLERLKATDRLVFEVRSATTFPKASIALVSCTGHAQQRRARLRSMSVTGSCSLWAYEGEVERELSEITGSIEQLAGLEEMEEEKKESGSLFHGSENRLREY